MGWWIWKMTFWWLGVLASLLTRYLRARRRDEVFIIVFAPFFFNEAVHGA